jgi:hypothetical protein
MIANNHIGNLGRLGNQMFQYASLRGIASKHGYEYCLPPEEIVGSLDANCASSDTNIFSCFKLAYAPKVLLDAPQLEETSFTRDDNIWNNCPDNVSLFGYFQTEKYFNNIEEEIRKDFTFIDEVNDSCMLHFINEYSGTDVISLHIRRGDYLKHTHHPVPPIEYYQEALNTFPELPVIIFSDDVMWCKKQQLFEGDRFNISESNDTAVDLCLQSLCSYHIIANSSYSWWGAWLANSEHVIAPKTWFGHPLTHDTKDLFPNGWKLC